MSEAIYTEKTGLYSFFASSISYFISSVVARNKRMGNNKTSLHLQIRKKSVADRATLFFLINNLSLIHI